MRSTTINDSIPSYRWPGLSSTLNWPSVNYPHQNFVQYTFPLFNSQMPSIKVYYISLDHTSSYKCNDQSDTQRTLQLYLIADCKVVWGGVSGRCFRCWQKTQREHILKVILNNQTNPCLGFYYSIVFVIILQKISCFVVRHSNKRTS